MLRHQAQPEKAYGCEGPAAGLLTWNAVNQEHARAVLNIVSSQPYPWPDTRKQTVLEGHLESGIPCFVLNR